MLKPADYWVETLELTPHPEGGHFREIYRAAENIPLAVLPDRFQALSGISLQPERSFCTSIYFLLQSGQFSALHRIKSDELWHFYAGSPLTVYEIAADGILREIRLGRDPERGEVFQAAVPAGSWFGAMMASQAANDYALVGCTVAPGFDFADFEMGDRQKLLQDFPQHGSLIARLTRP